MLAFGSPLGLDNSVSMGIVSARARQFERDSPLIYVQTDAAINPGNSGGPMVNTEGRVVGINTMILPGSGGDEGLGFAVPSNIVRAVFGQIRATGRVRRGIIGVRAQTITPILAAGLGLPQERGVILSNVFPRGPSAAAGLEVGDVVLTMDGKLMENGRQFTVNLYQKPIASTVKLEILRAGERRDFAVEFVERPDDPQRFADLVTPELNLGLLLDELRWREGVLVAARVPGVVPWAEGFEPGDVIFRVNGDPVRTLAGLRARVSALAPGDAAVFQVQRDDELIYVSVRI